MTEPSPRHHCSFNQFSSWFQACGGAVACNCDAPQSYVIQSNGTSQFLVLEIQDLTTQTVYPLNLNTRYPRRRELGSVKLLTRLTISLPAPSLTSPPSPPHLLSRNHAGSSSLPEDVHCVSRDLTPSHCEYNYLTIRSGAVCCIGGPALMYYVTPSEGELFKVCLLATSSETIPRP